MNAWRDLVVAADSTAPLKGSYCLTHWDPDYLFHYVWYPQGELQILVEKWNPECPHLMKARCLGLREALS